MSKSKAAAATAPQIDPASDETVVWWVGPRSARDAPARDLTHADIARIAYRESLRAVVRDVGTEVDGEVIARPDPRQPDQALCAEILEDLVASEQFTTEAPAVDPPDESETPAEAPATTEEPADV